MKNHLITIKEYCVLYQAEPSFLDELEDLGLIRILEEGSEKYIDEEQIPDIERYNRMFYDLEINIEGIDAIRHLLEKMETMQKEINALRNRLRFYE